jgi:hypothetical protein
VLEVKRRGGGIEGPSGVMFEDSVENGEQLAHGGGERHLREFTLTAQPQVKGFERDPQDWPLRLQIEQSQRFANLARSSLKGEI